MANYCPGGRGCAAGAGVVAGPPTSSTLSFVAEVSPSPETDEESPAILVESTLRTKMSIANDQVAFSKKSAVRLTPITCDPDWKPDASPPPLGFCTNTASTSRQHAMKIKIEIAVIISVMVYQVFFSDLQ